MSALPLFAPQTVKARPLRPHQTLALDRIRHSLRHGSRRIVVQMATGAGKTRIAAEIVLRALDKGNRVAHTVPAISLVDQTVEAFQNEGIDALGVVQSNHARTHYGMPVQVCSVQSLARRSCPPVDMVIVDECHMQFRTISDWMEREPNKIFIGLSATPWARGMADRWQDLIVPVRMQELIDQNFLSPYRVFAPSHSDLTAVATVKGDYHEGQSAEVMSGLVADVVDTWLAKGEGRPTLVFAVNCAHARLLQEQFRHRGVPMGYCDAYVDLVERQLLFDQLGRGELAGIVNVGTLTIGVDADIRCIVMARPTKSEMLFVQCIGRGLRTAKGKADCLILDHADNHARLGFVTDIHHDQLLAGKEKNRSRQDRGEPLPKECGSCGILKPLKTHECPSCGFKPIAQSGVTVAEGELIEIAPKDKHSVAPLEERQVWYSGLLAVASERKRSDGWAAHAYQKKFGAWPSPALHKIRGVAVPEVRRFARYLDIKFAKAKGRT